MALLEWKDRYALGIPDVDYEHRALIALINTLHERLEAGEPATSISAFFGDLYAEIAAHFALEERIMRERGYPSYEPHKADHERLLDQIRDIMDDYESGHDRAYRLRLGPQLDRWFTRHFQTMDAALHQSMGQPAQSAPGT